uniref:ATP-dependent DNA helicase n=1 Tax=Tanacetum cinerariifolium TaxID=118510 RepID=A0A699JVN4_TANCI|nr:hypothetical protein [Tanacetum cinerariifolium]
MIHGSCEAYASDSSCMNKGECTKDNDDPEVIVERISSSKIKFTEWMVANQKYPEADIGQFFTSSLLYLTPDVVHTQHCRLLNPHIVFTEEEIQNYTLLEIESILNSGNSSLSNFLELPTIISRIWLIGKVVLSVASSGIASLLLPGGRTYHSTFRIPIDLDKDSCCAIDVKSNLAELIKVVELIIWVEAPLQHRHAFEAVDRTFWDIYKDHVRGGHNKVFGGKVVVLGGDFRQIIPVVTNGTRFDVATSAVNKSDLIWRNCKVYVLSINMHLRNRTLADSNVEQLRLCTNWLLDMGDGRLPAIALDGEDEATWITIPDDLLLPVSLIIL